MKEYKDCLNCSNSFSDGEDGDYKLMCVVLQIHVPEDYVCDEWN